MGCLLNQKSVRSGSLENIFSDIGSEASRVGSLWVHLKRTGLLRGYVGSGRRVVQGLADAAAPIQCIRQVETERATLAWRESRFRLDPVAHTRARHVGSDR